MLHPITALTAAVKTGQDRHHFWQFLIPAVGSLLGNMASGRAAGRQQAANTNLQRDQLATSQYGINQNALIQSLLGAANQQTANANTDLARRQFTLNAPNQRAATAVRGDVMSRSQPLSINFQKGQIPTFSGGPSLADLSPESRQLGQSLARNALTQQLKGDEFQPLETQNWTGAVLPRPGQAPLPKATGFDKFLSIAAPITGLVGAGASAVSGDQNQALIQQLLQQATQGNPSAAANGPRPMPMPAGWTLPRGGFEPIDARAIPGWSYGVRN